MTAEERLYKLTAVVRQIYHPQAPGDLYCQPAGSGFDSIEDAILALAENYPSVIQYRAEELLRDPRQEAADALICAIRDEQRITAGLEVFPF